MKIVHISTQDSGGAGIAALRLHLGLKSIGVKSKMLVISQSSSDSDILRFIQNNYLRGILNRLRARLILSEFNAYRNNLPQGLDLFSDDRSIHTFSKHPLVQEADVINLHWIAGMVNYTEFFFNIKNKALVWTLHDMNPFTGGCHYAGNCTKYETGCGACPQLGSKNPNDLSRRIWKRKERCYKEHNIRIITPSKWLSDCARKSLLFKDFKTDVIPNGLATSIFAKRNKQYSRELFNLPVDKIIISLGSFYKIERKGFKYAMQALKQLKEKYNISNMAVAILGDCIDTLPTEIGIPIYPLGNIRDALLLSCCYSATDIFMIPSLEDNCPNMVLEAMACGTSVVGFKTGGIPEIVKPKETGLLAEVGNIQELSEQIKWMIDHPEEREQMGLNARKVIEREHAIELQAKRYFNLYESIS